MAEMDRQRAERERLERERVEKQQAATRARKDEIERVLQQSRKLQQSGKLEEALQSLSAALKRYPDSQELKSELDSVQAEIAKQRAEKKRARSAVKTEEVIQSKTAPAEESAAPEAKPVEGIFADPRRRLVLVAGAVLALAIIIFLVTRSIWTTNLQVTFTLDPPDAKLKIDGTPWDCPGGKCTHSLSAQDHKVVAEKSGYNSALAVAGPHSEKNLTLRLVRLPVPEQVASLAIVSDAATPDSVIVDGKQVGSLSAQQLILPDLAAGTHKIEISQDAGTLELTVEVSSEGTPQVTEVHGLEQIPVVAMTQNGDRQEIFFRGDGEEIRIDGKKLTPAGSNRYPVPGKGAVEHQVTLIRNGQSEPIPPMSADAKHGTVFIASGPPQTKPLSEDARIWQTLQYSRDCGALLKFQARFSHGPYARLAYLRCGDVTWENTSTSTKADDYLAYAHNFPDSAHTQAAKDKYAELKLKERPPEETEWDNLNKGDQNALAQYIAKYKTSKHASEAHQLMAGLEWNKIQGSSDPNVLQSFLQKYGTTSYASKASDLLKKLQQHSTPPDEEAWTSTDKQDPSALIAFNEKYPTSDYARLAREQLGKLAQVKWDKISGLSQLADFEKFTHDYPGTPHIPEADDRIKQIKAKLQADAELLQNRQLILSTLDAFRSAYERKDLKALAYVWPNPPVFFKKQFSDLDKINVTLTRQQDPQINGASGTVLCTLKVYGHGKKLPLFEEEHRYTLRKVQDRWIIEKDN